MLQVEDGYAAEGTPHVEVSIEAPGSWRSVGKLARWRMGLVKRSPHAEYYTHVPEPNANVPERERERQSILEQIKIST